MKNANLYRMLTEKACVGTFLKIPRPEIVHLLALAGFDFLVCDMEHAQISETEARTVIQACVSVGIPVTVRLPDPAQGLVNRLLEAGATGIQMPRLRSAKDTNDLYSIMHFPGEGVRSVSLANACANYGAVPVIEYLKDANERALVIGQFETFQIDEPIDTMMQNLDVAFIGPMDLTVDFGVPGQYDHPEVVARIRSIEAAAARTDTFMGAMARSAEQAAKLIAAGYRYVIISGDTSILGSGAKTLVKSIHDTVGGAVSAKHAEIAAAKGF